MHVFPVTRQTVESLSSVKLVCNAVAKLVSPSVEPRSGSNCWEL